MGGSCTQLINVDTLKNLLTGESALLVDDSHHLSTYTVELTANHGAAAEITPSSGKHLSIHSIFCTSATNSGAVKLDFLTSSKVVFRLFLAQQTRASTIAMHINGAVDEVLTLETSQGNNDLFLVVNYHEPDD